MKFLLIHTWNPYSSKRIGGVETFLKDLMDILVLKYDAKLLTWNEVKKPFRIPKFSEKTIPRKRRMVPDVLKFGINIFLSRQFWQNRDRILIIQRPELSFFLRKLLPNCKIVLFLHTDQFANAESSTDSLWIYYKKFYKKYISMCYKSSDFIYTFSKKSIPFIIEHNKKCFQLSASADTKFITNNIDKREGIIWIGRLENPKNPILAAKILTACLMNGFKVQMIGEGNLLTQVLSTINGKFKLRKFMNQSELADTLSKNKYLIMTSQFEGSPRILVEALVAGCFIILNSESDPDLLRVIFPDRIYMVKNPNPKNYLDMIKRIDANQNLENNINLEDIKNLLNPVKFENLVRSLESLEFGGITK